MILKTMFLCEAATINPDNTFSVLRGGINMLNLTMSQGANIAQLPPVSISLVATLELEVTEMGRLHNLELALMDADGHRIIPELRSNFQPAISPRKGYHNILLNLFIPFRNSGEYCFYVNVDGHELGSFPFQIIIHQAG